MTHKKHFTILHVKEIKIRQEKLVFLGHEKMRAPRNLTIAEMVILKKEAEIFCESFQPIFKTTRVGTLIVATTYL